MGFNCYYDVKNLKMQNLTTFLSRDMHCWQLTINVTPVGSYRSFNITINPNQVFYVTCISTAHEHSIDAAEYNFSLVQIPWI